MKTVNYQTKGTCARAIHFELDDENRIHNISFDGGCNGNLKAIGKLCEGQKADTVASILAGNTCGFKPTSCADQLSRAIRENI